MSYEHRNVASTNANWKGGVSRRYSNVTLRPRIIIRDGDQCWICRTTAAKLEVHHLDSNHRNNSLENLRLLCRSCHTREHHKGGMMRLAFNPAVVRKLPDIQCPICSQIFRPRHSKSRYCSIDCKNKQHSLAMRGNTYAAAKRRN